MEWQPFLALSTYPTLRVMLLFSGFIKHISICKQTGSSTYWLYPQYIVFNLTGRPALMLFFFFFFTQKAVLALNDVNRLGNWSVRNGIRCISGEEKFISLSGCSL